MLEIVKIENIVQRKRKEGFIEWEFSKGKEVKKWQIKRLLNLEAIV